VSTITTRDGAQIFYKDWGIGQPLVFSHGWPLSADDWEEQMMFLAAHGFRCVAHDRRGHGRSSQTWHGNDMDTYADDLAAVVRTLDLKNTVHVGHGSGGGEVARYVGRHGTKRVAKVVLIGAVPPLLTKCAANPGGLSTKVFDELRTRALSDRSQFLLELCGLFYGAARREISEGMRRGFWLQGMQAGLRAIHDSIKAFSETDFSDDLKQFDVPTLLVHGSEDEIVPIRISAIKSSNLIHNAQLLAYEGAPHGLNKTHGAKLNQDMLAFLRG
jgi:non-heme chloroperoxidase